jgi:hypothetical protein
VTRGCVDDDVVDGAAAIRAVVPGSTTIVVCGAADRRGGRCARKRVEADHRDRCADAVVAIVFVEFITIVVVFISIVLTVLSALIYPLLAFPVGRPIAWVGAIIGRWPLA